MSNHSEEDYLDQLLYSLGDGSSAKKTVKEKKPASTREEFEQELFGELEPEKSTAKDEEEFLREFEAELLKDEFSEVENRFSENLFPEQELSAEKEPEDVSLDEILANMSVPEKTPLVDEDAEFEGELPEEPKETTEPEKTIEPEKTAEPEKNVEPEENSVADGLSLAMGDFDEKISGDNHQEEILAEDKDLMDLLSGDDQLVDLGELLSGAEEGKPLEGADTFDEFAKAQMIQQKEALSEETEAQEDGQEAAPEKKAKKKKKNTKNKEKGTSVFDKISKLFFGEESDDIVVLPDDGSGEIMELSAENQQILQELAAADQKDTSGKGKKDHNKKEKKKKPPKPKKEKKPKTPKPKKEKKQKPVDHTPPLPKGPVIAIAFMVVSLTALVLLGTATLGYQANVNAAKEAYQQGHYVEAYQKMQGLKVKAKDEKLYGQLAALAAVSEKYQAYLIFDSHGSKDMALDSLVCAYGRCGINRANAKEYGCEPELEAMKTKIVDAMGKDFSMKEEEAAELYKTKDRDAYTIRIHNKLKEIGVE